MKLIYRIAYYLGGFVIGLILLYFFLNGKQASCDYTPTARTLKNIRNKERVFTENVLLSLHQHQTDTSVISKILISGDVLFSESLTELDSCKQYIIKGKVKDKLIKLRVENCNKVARVLTVEFGTN